MCLVFYMSSTRDTLSSAFPNYIALKNYCAGWFCGQIPIQKDQIISCTYHHLTQFALDKFAAVLHMFSHVLPSHWLTTLLAGLWVVLTVSLIVWLYGTIIMYMWHWHHQKYIHTATNFYGLLVSSQGLALLLWYRCCTCTGTLFYMYMYMYIHNIHTYHSRIKRCTSWVITCYITVVGSTPKKPDKQKEVNIILVTSCDVRIYSRYM